ncbi:hypothetical protein DFH06DRAFT_970630 [Mycena polygramma]|nr:hypothetical protein DFH06DRAFT_970630 [Mycena polygramma]
MTNPYQVFRIPVPPSEDDVIKYSQLRLLGLKTNPEAFGSTFERESQNTQAMWRARIDKEERYTIIACSVPQGECVGNASILTPEMIRVYSDSRHSSSYELVGMWVHPEHRRKEGLGKQLVDFGVDWVRSRTEASSTLDAERRVTLEVRRSNVSAQAFYAGLGFAELKDGECEDPRELRCFLWPNNIRRG